MVTGAEQFGIGDGFAVSGDGILLLPEFNFFLGTVRAGIRWAVTGVAIGHGFQQHRAGAFFQHLALADDGIGNGEWVVAIHALGVHAFGVGGQAQASHHAVAHGFTHGLAAHAVEIIHEIED